MSCDLGKPLPYTQPNVSRISSPARRILSPIRSCVRAPAKTAICPPGFNTRIHSSHTAGGGTKLSQSFPMKPPRLAGTDTRSEEHTSELQSRFDLVCRLLLEKKQAK